MKRKVLYVENDKDDIHLLKHHIGKYFDVKAVDSYECINLLKNKPKYFDVVLLDLYWGKSPSPETGFDILNEIRKDFTPSQLPVVIYTREGVEKDSLKALKLEAQDWLWKRAEASEKVWRLHKAISHFKEKKINYNSGIIQKMSTIMLLVYGLFITFYSIFRGDNFYSYFSIIFLIVASVLIGKVSIANVKLKTEYGEIDAEFKGISKIEEAP